MSKYKEKIEEAVEASSLEQVPEELRAKTFEVVLRHELNSDDNSVPRKRTANKRSFENSNHQRKDELSDWEMKVIEDLPKASIAAKGNRSQQTMWAVITLYSRGELADRETVPTVIKDELGQTPQSGNNTARSLKKLFPDFLSRNKDGKGYNYEPTRNSLEVFQGLISDE